MNEFLTKVSQLFSKDMLFASVLPGLLFIVSVFIVFLLILGFNNVIYAYSALSANSILFITFYSLLFLIVFSYVLHSVRSFLLKFWSGDFIPNIWPFNLFIRLHELRFKRMREKLQSAGDWVIAFQKLAPVLEMFHLKPSIPMERQNELLQKIREIRMDDDENKIRIFLADLLLAYEQYIMPSPDPIEVALSRLMRSWERRWESSNETLISIILRFLNVTGKGKNSSLRWRIAYSKFLYDKKITCKNELTAHEEEELLNEILALKKGERDMSEFDAILNQLREAFNSYSGRSLRKVHEALTDLIEWQNFYDAEIASALDISYGSLSTIKGTRLGNIIDSYNRYSYKRYGMASEIFWPKLQTVIQKEYQELLQNQKTTLDFFVTSCSLSLLFLFLVFLGPRIYYSAPFWILLGIISIIVCVLCYWMAVASATSLGHIVRSCYDLHRLKLLKSLSFEFPKDIKEERLLWESYSTFRIFTYTDRVIALRDYDEKKKPE